MQSEVIAELLTQANKLEALSNEIRELAALFAEKNNLNK